jgi:hypothetical protein
VLLVLLPHQELLAQLEHQLQVVLEETGMAE